MAGVATVFTGGAFASEAPRALTAEIAVGWDCEGGGLEFVSLGAAFDVSNSLEDGLDLNLKGG